MVEHATAARRPESLPGLDLMAQEVREGLQRPLPELPSKYFYDDRGSRLFEEITRLPEYYPTRTEIGILERVAREVVDRVASARDRRAGVGRGAEDPAAPRRRRGGRGRGGSSSSTSTRRSCAARSHGCAPTIRGFRDAASSGDFSQGLGPLGPGGGRLLLFLGGTLGNFYPAVVPVSSRTRREHLAPGDCFLVGVDLVKDVARLEAAYNDSRGVTAAFNRNILRVMNNRARRRLRARGLGARGLLRHRALLDRDAACAPAPPSAWRCPARARRCAFARGDEIRTEISCKYTRDVVRGHAPDERARPRALVHGRGRPLRPRAPAPRRAGHERFRLAGRAATGLRLEAAWDRSDVLFARCSRSRRCCAAPDPLAPAVPLLPGPPARVRLEPPRPERARGAGAPMPSSTSCSRAASILPTRRTGRPTRRRGRRRTGARLPGPRSRSRLRPHLDEPGLESTALMVLEHELMHHETLLYMMLRARPRLEAAAPRARPLTCRPRPTGAPERRATFPAAARVWEPIAPSLPFGWDNEFPGHEVDGRSLLDRRDARTQPRLPGLRRVGRLFATGGSGATRPGNGGSGEGRTRPVVLAGGRVASSRSATSSPTCRSNRRGTGRPS